MVIVRQLQLVQGYLPQLAASERSGARCSCTEQSRESLAAFRVISGAVESNYGGCKQFRFHQSFEDAHIVDAAAWAVSKALSACLARTWSQLTLKSSGQ